jgi:hypothetical protein
VSSPTSESDRASEYHPGACNIGGRQRRARARNAVISFAVAGAVVAAELLGYLPNEALLAGVFVPLTLGFEWAIQAYDAFCVRLALLGQYDFRADGGGSVGEVAGSGDRRRDGFRAAKITAASVLFGAVTTLALVLVL